MSAVRLLDAGRLIQTLLLPLESQGFTVAADLDVDSIDDIPFLTHSSLVSRDANADGLWNVQLVLNLFATPDIAFDSADAVHQLVDSWGALPLNGVVSGLGGVEEVEDGNALSQSSGPVYMENKIVLQYSGSYNLTVKNLNF